MLTMSVATEVDLVAFPLVCLKHDAFDAELESMTSRDRTAWATHGFDIFVFESSQTPVLGWGFYHERKI